jgi:hypothetical protein
MLSNIADIRFFGSVSQEGGGNLIVFAYLNWSRAILLNLK